MKTMPQYFHDWECSAFGFGYGSGEEHTVPALRKFLELCSDGDAQHSYDYRNLELVLTPVVAWLLINKLCNHHIDMIEYGTSPRFAWLNPKGERLKAFMLSHTAEELVEMTNRPDDDYVECYPDHCNCDEEKCHNPFWE